MRRHINLTNISIVTNTKCNLRCNHCYIEENLLSSNNMITKEIYLQTYKQIDNLVRKENKMNGTAIETLGGEASMMPIQFWKDVFPDAIQYHKSWRELLRTRPVFAFCTNLIIRDDEYFDLFEKYKDSKEFELFISYETDTGRYGKNNKLLKTYFKNLEKVKGIRKTLNLIPTVDRINEDIDHVRTKILEPFNFDDISNDMLYQFGVGKDFFEEHQPKYHEVSEWYIKITDYLKDYGITLSPREEILKSLYNDESFHCMGNDAYDIQFHFDGTVTLNSSMTGSDSVKTVRHLDVFDKLFSSKIMFENCSEFNHKINFKFDFCDQCEYLSYCNSGYYHHRMLPDEKLNELTEKDCPGFSKIWKHIDEETKYRPSRHSTKIKNNFKRSRKVRNYHSKLSGRIYESDHTSDYEAFIEATGNDEYLTVVVENKTIFEKTLEERLWYYDSLYKKAEFNCNILDIKNIDRIILNYIYDNFDSIEFDFDDVVKVLDKYKDKREVKRIFEAAYLIGNSDAFSGESEFTPSGLKISNINTEIFIFLLSLEGNNLEKISSYCEIDFSVSKNCLQFIDDLSGMIY